MAQVAGIGTLVVLLAVALLVVFLVGSAVRIVNEYERGVIFRLGRVQGPAKGPGLFFLVPIRDKMVKVDLTARFTVGDPWDGIGHARRSPGRLRH